MNTSKKGAIKYLSALLLFGSNGIVASHIAMSSYEIVWTRTLIGGLLLAAIYLFSKEKKRFWQNKKHLGLLVLSGFAMGANWMFLYEAYAQIGVSVATLLCYCGPVIVLALSTVMFRERMSAAKIAGISAALLGMACLNGMSLLQGGFSWGLACGLLSAVMYALMVVSNKKATTITGLENAMCQLFSAFFIVSVFLLIKQGAAISFTASDVWPTLLLGIINTGGGCYLYFSSIQQLRAQSVAIFGYLEPLSALFFSAIILSERLTWLQLLGAALILGGAAFAELFRRKVRSKS